MVFNFTVKFKVFVGAGFRESVLLNDARKFPVESLFYAHPDKDGYYRFCFTRLRDCKAFLNYLVCGTAYGYCVFDAYIVSYNSNSCLRAVVGYRRVNQKKIIYLSYKKC